MRVLFFLLMIAIVGAKPIVKDESTLKTEPVDTTESVEWEEGLLAAESEIEKGVSIVEPESEKDVTVSEKPVHVEPLAENSVSIEPVVEIPVYEDIVNVKAEKHVKAKPSTPETV